VTCLGNHDTDFGIARMKELIALTNSVWLMANLFVEGKIIGDLPRSHILEYKG
jgi:2',3'-cyclic-nucleotide 2'-phosphodiesterase (5'-nucleotidase family)